MATMLSPTGVVDPALFEKTSEAAMLAVLQQLEPLAREAAQTANSPDLAALAAALRERPALAAFFDGDSSVMVMAEDQPAARQPPQPVGRAAQPGVGAG